MTNTWASDIRTAVDTIDHAADMLDTNMLDVVTDVLLRIADEIDRSDLQPYE